jgi:hypothetical protein
MSHDSALQAHEHSEHARHAAHSGDVFISRIAISVAVLAVLAAVSGSLETVEGGRALNNTSEAVLEQDKATDAWAEYQADSLKKHIYGVAADAGGPHADRYRRLVQENTTKQDAIRRSARTAEAERNRLLAASSAHEERHHWLTGAATLFEIGIAMSTVAIITRRHWLWFTALGFGAVGVALLAAAYLV